MADFRLVKDGNATVWVNVDQVRYVQQDPTHQNRIAVVFDNDQRLIMNTAPAAIVGDKPS